MKATGELLRDADPLKHEPTWPSGERDVRRQAVLAAASGSSARTGLRSRSRIAVFAVVALMVIVVSSLGSRVWSPFVSDLQGAVRFEVRLAEDKPAPGLREAKVSGSDRSVYLHDEVIVDNSNIAAARVVEADGPSQYAVDIKFNASGAEKMRAATGNHIGKPVAILLDGLVVMAPVVRSPISESAVITGHFTRTQAERIVKGIAIQ
jgi:hypothetical protein